ncbi:MAG: hypothetical protein R3Y24_09810 [Eubacteriales bacterium]
MNKSRIVVVYDEPIESCNKKWVHEGLEKKFYQVEVIGLQQKLSFIEQQGIKGKISARIMILKQAFQVKKVVTQDDIVFCWNQWFALFFQLVTRGSYKMISYNWLTPNESKKTAWLYRHVLENKNARIIINSKENRTKILNQYGAKDLDNIFYIPDVYDNKETFKKPKYDEERFCFMGGRANRDWDVFLQVAKSLPNMKFVGVAPKSDWDVARQITDNVEMHFDIDAAQYYEYMDKSFLALFPLKENRVSALINIAQAIQRGKLVLVSDIPCTKLYFAEEQKNLLLPLGDVSAMVREIECICNLSVEEYEEKVVNHQEYLRKNFSPEMAIEKIEYLMNETYS